MNGYLEWSRRILAFAGYTGPGYLDLPADFAVRGDDDHFGGYGTTVDHVLAMALDDPSMDDDLHKTLAAHEIVLGEE
ncbi:MAG: hypothetical protein ABSF26_14180 [Thermoguttaceae bacterium]